jgi:inner membrane protein
VVLAVTACLLDAAKRRAGDALMTAGLLDEATHLATAALGLLVLACFFDLPRRFYLAALVASVAIDLDHIPLFLGFWGVDGRPNTHSLATVAVLASAAAASRRHRAVLGGAAAGVLLHFARDIAEGPPGVRMLWPLSQAEWTAGYGVWLGLVVVLAAARLTLVGFGFPRRRARPFAPLAAEHPL